MEPNFEIFRKAYLEACSAYPVFDTGRFCLMPTSFDERIEVEASMWSILSDPTPSAPCNVQIFFKDMNSSYWINSSLSEEALLEEFIRISNELTGMHLCNAELPAFCQKYKLHELLRPWRPITLDAVVEASLFHARGCPLEHKEMLLELLGIIRNENAKKHLQEFIKYWYGEF